MVLSLAIEVGRPYDLFGIVLNVHAAHLFMSNFFLCVYRQEFRVSKGHGIKHGDMCLSAGAFGQQIKLERCDDKNKNQVRICIRSCNYMAHWYWYLSLFPIYSFLSSRIINALFLQKYVAKHDQIKNAELNLCVERARSDRELLVQTCVASRSSQRWSMMKAGSWWSLSHQSNGSRNIKVLFACSHDCSCLCVIVVVLHLHRRRSYC